MPIPFTCPYCGLQTSVAAQYAGQSGPCAGCGKLVTVPSSDFGSQPRAPVHRPTPSSSSAKAIILVVAVAIVGVVGIFAIAGLLIALLVPSINLAQRSATQSKCADNLRRIGEALQRYHDANGRFPPAYVTDANGARMHSWRVLLLPYFGDQEKLLYERYDFTKPWDSPENRALTQRMPAVYGCPDDRDGEFGDTSYMLVLGQGAVFEADRSVSRGDITDGLADTILVVESVGAGVSWLAPTDLDLNTMPLHVNRGQRGGICSQHASGGANVLMADGSVRSLPDHLSAEDVRAMITIDGRDAVSGVGAGE